MPFELGNQEAAKGNHRRPKLFRDALLVAIKEADADGVEAIQHLARALVTEGKSGNVAAIKEIADRIDGRIPQAIVGSDDDPPIAVVTDRDAAKVLGLLIEEIKAKIEGEAVDVGNIGEDCET
jgi:hypothetical protein